LFTFKCRLQNMKMNVIKIRVHEPVLSEHWTVSTNILNRNLLICSTLHGRNSPSPCWTVIHYVLLYIYIWYYSIIFWLQNIVVSVEYIIVRVIVCVRVATGNKLQTEIDFKLTLPRNKLYSSTRYIMRVSHRQTHYIKALAAFARRGCIITIIRYTFYALLYLHIHDTIYTNPFNNVSALRLHFPVPFIFSLLRVSPKRNWTSSTTT